MSKKSTVERCEGCGAPAKRTDSEGVPLCNKCFAGLVKETRMKVTITIEDEGETGATVKTEFDPPITDDSLMTPASSLALRIIKAIPKLVKADRS